MSRPGVAGRSASRYRMMGKSTPNAAARPRAASTTRSGASDRILTRVDTRGQAQLERVHRARRERWLAGPGGCPRDGGRRRVPGASSRSSSPGCRARREPGDSRRVAARAGHGSADRAQANVREARSVVRRKPSRSRASAAAGNRAGKRSRQSQ